MKIKRERWKESERWRERKKERIGQELMMERDKKKVSLRS